MQGTAKPTAEVARNMLELANRGIAALQNSPSGPWIALWAGTVTLLRTVGHALVVDAKRDPRLSVAQQEWWIKVQGHKSNPGENFKIFWHFIDKDKNNLLHDAIINASQSVTIYPEPRGAIYDFKMISGPYSGYDSTKLVKQAATWWVEQIAEIERNAV
ncbi:hypothetical protein [Belnapia sp. F-4-1]|uniref:hypothetical protein n=1 Tax=Belnapia sp. F-4-1 TaxID=1545443 RepID=UPI001185D005|nr:hypothetical protein [Belnapia sp. F-4-1]